MMATTAMQLAIDAFGPIADNAGGIAEMSEPKSVREKTDFRCWKHYCSHRKRFQLLLGTYALALFAAFVGIAGIDGIDIYTKQMFSGAFHWSNDSVYFSHH